MLTLRKVLLYDKIYFFILLLSLLYASINIVLIPKVSLYEEGDMTIEGEIKDYIINGSKLTLTIQAKEKIITYYYFENEDEKKLFSDDYSLGDYIILTGTLIKPTQNYNFNLFNYKTYLENKNIYFTMSVESFSIIESNSNLLVGLKNSIYKRIAKISYGKEYVSAFVLGKTTYIESIYKESFRKNGISHLFAISGMHISFFSLFLLFILKKIGIEENKKYIIIILFLSIYAFIANFSPSILRATLFFLFLSINKIFFFHIKTFNIVILTFSLLTFVNPLYLFDTGFQYSFIISFFLVRFSFILNKSKNYFITAFLVSFISFMASIPLTIFNFYQLNFLSPFINILLVPFVSLLVFPMALLTLIFPFLSFFFNILIIVLETLSLYFANFTFITFVFAKPPLIIVVLYYLLIYLFFLFFKKRWLTVMLLVFLLHANIAHFNKYPYLISLYVGQGDSTLISYENSKCNILIDTGGIQSYNREDWEKSTNTYSLAKQTLIPVLQSHGISHLDYLIITHGDYDHIGEAIDLVENFKVKKVIFNFNEINSNEEKLIEKLKVLNINYIIYNFINLNIENVKIVNFKEYGNENDNSLITFFNINDYKLLFPGDISKEVELDLIKYYPNLSLDILKLSHHGSNSSSAELFLKQTNPEYAIISAGVNNKFNHPSTEVLNILNDQEIKSLSTINNGSIKIIFKSQIEIYTVLKETQQL